MTKYKHGSAMARTTFSFLSACLSSILHHFEYLNEVVIYSKLIRLSIVFKTDITSFSFFFLAMLFSLYSTADSGFIFLKFISRLFDFGCWGSFRCVQDKDGEYMPLCRF